MVLNIKPVCVLVFETLNDNRAVGKVGSLVEELQGFARTLTQLGGILLQEVKSLKRCTCQSDVLSSCMVRFVLTVKRDDQMDCSCLYPWSDLVEVGGEGGVIHNAVESILVGHVCLALGVEIPKVVGSEGYGNMNALLRFSSSFVLRLCMSQSSLTETPVVISGLNVSHEIAAGSGMKQASRSRGCSRKEARLFVEAVQREVDIVPGTQQSRENGDNM